MLEDVCRVGLDAVEEVIVTFPAEERHRPSIRTKLYWQRCEQLAQACYAALSRWELNPRPTDRMSMPYRYATTPPRRKVVALKTEEYPVFEYPCTASLDDR